jgi:hypothetical protein
MDRALTPTHMGQSVRERCDAIEECYEFMLAYAAQGVAGDAGSPSAGQLRTLLTRAEEAILGLADAFGAAVTDARLQPAARYQAFLAVLDRDARDSLAAVQLVLAQPAISSQLVDNLNASIHVRALLTDIFLIDEVLTPQRPSTEPP